MPTHVLLVTAPRVAPAGLLTRAAWVAFGAGPVLAADGTHPQLGALAEQGVDVRLLAAGPGARADPGAAAAALLAAAAATGTASWLLAGSDDPLAADLEAALAGQDELRLERLAAGPEVTGAALLSAVATMDRLRSPGGCPWDAEQTHDSLCGYLLEETYEAVEAIESGDVDTHLAEELGDVLLQVLFHARIAAERTPEAGFDIDDVATALVTKLVRRHPHVFAVEPDEPARSAAWVEGRWEAIKAVEKQRSSVLDGIPTAQPALSYAAAVLRRAARAGLELAGTDPASPVSQGGSDDPAQVAEAGRRLLAEVSRCVSAGVDPEAALRQANRALAAAVSLAETSATRV